MTIKNRSYLFIFIGMLVNIIITIAIVAALSIGSLLLMLRVFKLPTDSIVIQVLLPFIFIIGLVLGLICYTRLAGWVIRTFHMEDKLTPDLVRRYNKSKKDRL